VQYKETRMPIDIIICLLLSILLVPLALLDIEGALRIILGLPFILFIPGYVFIYALFPEKKNPVMEKGIDVIERIALSFGLSIAIVPLIGLALNYTPWGIRLQPVLISIFSFIVAMSLISWYRFQKTEPEKRFIVDIKIDLPKEESRLDRALTIILVASIVIAAASLVYVIVTPKTGEKFTEFYLLGPGGMADEYPRNLTINQSASVIIGVVNHEYREINYTIEVWLINQSLEYNNLTEENETLYHEMYHLDTIQTGLLNHTAIDIEGPWQPQWETNYSFTIQRNGTWKQAFLLYDQETTNSYDPTTNYANIAQQKIDEAYREVHLWLFVEEPSVGG